MMVSGDRDTGLLNQTIDDATSGTNPERGTYVAIKGVVFDVSGNDSYAPGKGYHGM